MSTVEQVVQEELGKAGLSLNEKEETNKGLGGMSTPPPVTKEKEETLELTAFELEQQKKGWNPHGRKTAEEWADNEPLVTELRAIRNENKRYQQTIDQLKAYVDKQEEITYKKALQDLAHERASAIERGDVAEVDRLDEAKANMAQQPEQTSQESSHPAVAEFYTKHDSWINGTSVTEIEMMAFAQERDRLIKQKNLPPEKHMKLLEECVMAKFPDYFDQGNEKEYVSAPVVESGSLRTSPSKNKKYTKRDLSQDQLAVLKNFELFKVMDEAAYIEGLVKAGELK